MVADSCDARDVEGGAGAEAGAGAGGGGHEGDAAQGGAGVKQGKLVHSHTTPHTPGNITGCSFSYKHTHTRAHTYCRARLFPALPRDHKRYHRCHRCSSMLIVPIHLSLHSTS